MVLVRVVEMIGIADGCASGSSEGCDVVGGGSEDADAAVGGSLPGVGEGGIDAGSDIVNI